MYLLSTASFPQSLHGCSLSEKPSPHTEYSLESMQYSWLSDVHSQRYREHFPTLTSLALPLVASLHLPILMNSYSLQGFLLRYREYFSRFPIVDANAWFAPPAHPRESYEYWNYSLEPALLVLTPVPAILYAHPREPPPWGHVLAIEMAAWSYQCPMWSSSRLVPIVSHYCGPIFLVSLTYTPFVALLLGDRPLHSLLGSSRQCLILSSCISEDVYTPRRAPLSISLYLIHGPFYWVTILTSRKSFGTQCRQTLFPTCDKNKELACFPALIFEHWEIPL